MSEGELFHIHGSVAGKGTSSNSSESDGRSRTIAFVVLLLSKQQGQNTEVYYYKWSKTKLTRIVSYESPLAMVKNANKARRYGFKRLAPRLRHCSCHKALRSSPVNPDIAMATTFRSAGPLKPPAEIKTQQ